MAKDSEAERDYQRQWLMEEYQVFDSYLTQSRHPKSSFKTLNME